LIEFWPVLISISTCSPDGTITTTFEATPIMASYLLAFIVSDLEHISNADTKLAGETLHRIWVRPDSLSKAKYALENSEKALKALENFVGVKYELSKVDSAGVPNKSGAMENWGMVTYRWRLQTQSS
jgi:aminopeptidase N